VQGLAPVGLVGVQCGVPDGDGAAQGVAEPVRRSPPADGGPEVAAAPDQFFTGSGSVAAQYSRVTASNCW